MWSINNSPTYLEDAVRPTRGDYAICTILLLGNDFDLYTIPYTKAIQFDLDGDLISGGSNLLHLQRRHSIQSHDSEGYKVESSGSCTPHIWDYSQYSKVYHP